MQSSCSTSREEPPIHGFYVRVIPIRPLKRTHQDTVHRTRPLNITTFTNAHAGLAAAQQAGMLTSAAWHAAVATGYAAFIFTSNSLHINYKLLRLHTLHV